MRTILLDASSNADFRPLQVRRRRRMRSALFAGLGVAVLALFVTGNSVVGAQSESPSSAGKGPGVGGSGGWATNSFSESPSSGAFFGLSVRGDRIAVCVDVSAGMVGSEKGGAAGYQRLRKRLNDMIDALRDGTLFSVIVFAEGCSVIDAKMLAAGDETREKAKAFLLSANPEGHHGHDKGNFMGGSGVPPSGGDMRLDLALAAAMEMKADTILIVSGGLPRVGKAREPGTATATATNAVAPVHEPAAPEPEWWVLSDFVRHIGLLYEETYKPKGLAMPTLDCIGYDATREANAFLLDLSRLYQGHCRFVRKAR